MEFTYDENQAKVDKEFISDLINNIKLLGPEDAPKTTNIKRCSFCVYRSLCNRGVSVDLSDVDRDFNLEQDHEEGIIDNFDFDQIGEIEF